MMMINVVALLVALSSPNITIQRGAPVADGLNSWETQDTFIDKLQPSKDFGRDNLLSVGPGKIVLIQFPGLQRYISPGYRISSAKLVLRQAIGSSPQINRAGWVNDLWVEGYGRRGVPPNNPAILGSKSLASTSWNGRATNMPWNGSSQDWPMGSQTSLVQPLSIGGELVFEIPSEEANKFLLGSTQSCTFAFESANQADFFSSDNARFRPKLIIETEAVMTTMMTKPDLSIVHAIESASPDGKLTKWLVSIKNVGSAPSGLGRVEFNAISGAKLSQPISGLEPGASSSLEFATDASSLIDNRLAAAEIRVVASGQEDQFRNNTIFVAPNSISAKFSMSDAESRFRNVVTQWGYVSFADYVNAVTNYLNRVVLKQSRFSFAPDGIAGMIGIQPNDGGPKLELSLNESTSQEKAWLLTCRAVLASTGLKSLKGATGTNDNWAGIMLGGDTRDDFDVPTILGLSADPVFDPIQEIQPMDFTDLLSTTDAFLLQNKQNLGSSNPAELLPQTTILRLLTSSNRLLTKAEVKLFEGNSDSPFAALADSGSGILTLPDRGGSIFPNYKGFENASIRLEATKFGETASAILRGWQLVDSVARGGKDVTLIPIHFRLPDAKIVRTTNLALNRDFQEGQKLNVAFQLVTDGQDSSGITIEPSTTRRSFTLDLGKDRYVGEVELLIKGSNLWQDFQIRIQETGLNNENARLWSAEVNGIKTLAKYGTNQNGLTSLKFWGVPSSSRYIVFDVPPTATAVKLNEIRVHTYQQ